MTEFKTGDRVEVRMKDDLWYERTFLCFEGDRIWAYCDDRAFQWDEVRHSRKPAPDLPVDHPVWVRCLHSFSRPRHFVKFEDNLCKCFVEGKSSHSTCNFVVTGWPQYSLDSKTWYSAETHEEVEP